MIVIIMGVSGSGKSWLANALAKRTGWPFAEGDDYHSDANKAKMAAGIPLTDDDRAPWLQSLHNVMATWQQHGQSGILACSALKSTYRELLSESISPLKFVWLDPPREVLAERLAHRQGHYMPLALLDSQLATLEPPTEVLHLDGSQSLDEMVETVLKYLVKP